MFLRGGGGSSLKSEKTITYFLFVFPNINSNQKRMITAMTIVTKRQNNDNLIYQVKLLENFYLFIIKSLIRVYIKKLLEIIPQYCLHKIKSYHNVTKYSLSCFNLLNYNFY